MQRAVPKLASLDELEQEEVAATRLHFVPQPAQQVRLADPLAALKHNAHRVAAALGLLETVEQLQSRELMELVDVRAHWAPDVVGGDDQVQLHATQRQSFLVGHDAPICRVCRSSSPRRTAAWRSSSVSVCWLVTARR